MLEYILLLSLFFNGNRFQNRLKLIQYAALAQSVEQRFCKP